MRDDYLFTDEMKRGYYYNRLKEEGQISFFTEYSAIAEYYNGVNGVNNV